MKVKYYILFLLISMSLFAQKQVETKIDVTKNKIGAQFNLTYKTTVDTASKVVFPTLKNFGRMEVIRSYVVDTIKNGARYELIKKYGVTQFDSGKYVIPSLKILINNKVFATDSILVEVSDVPVDTLKQKLFDIKPIAESEFQLGNFWKYFLILLLILGLGALAYWLIKKYKNKQVEEVEELKSPIERATILLKNLEKKELWQKGAVKEYYSELTDIARNYIEEAIEIPAMESTTSELIIALRAASIKKKMTVSAETLENLERVLKQADLVKFAKSRPVDFEIAEDKNKIEKAILTLDKSIPIEIEPEEDTSEWDEMRRLQKLKKEKKTKILTAVGIGIGAIVALFIFLVATKGFDYVKDNIIGSPTKDLVEGQWVSSEYGNPKMYIETPKVLTRIDTSKLFPTEVTKMIKEASVFTYGSLQSNFYIALATAVPKQEVDYDLQKGLEEVIDTLGGQNVILKQEEFQTKMGISGLKGFGTMVMLDPISKSSVKLYFEIILFKENGGYQQVIVFHEEGDKYAEQISEKVMNSIEFKKGENNE
ncbi:MAG: BatD family protein [Flavobacterium sp.]|nr:BatD family protein [Flavobacterium sp.]